MNKTSRIMLIFGILLVIMGIVLWIFAGAFPALLGYAACVLMLAYGIGEIVFYVRQSNRQSAFGWALGDGILTIIFAVLLLFFPGWQILGVTILFATWVLFSGVTRVSGALASRCSCACQWFVIFIVNIAIAVAGILLMLDPLWGILVTGHLAAIAFIVQGICAFTVFCACRRGE